MAAFVGHHLSAAVFCHTGLVRGNNEDNFFFDGQYLPAENHGLKAPLLWDGFPGLGRWFAVLDGMGGENFGEQASFAAARALSESKRSLLEQPEAYVQKTALALNDSVVAAAKQLGTVHMGSTLAALYFTRDKAFVCNLGDSPVFLLRDGSLYKISVDHVSRFSTRKKPPLTQHLGIDPEDMVPEPYVKALDIYPGDRFLICSDGITDMLPLSQIGQIMADAEGPRSCTRHLVRSALEAGGRDNATALVIYLAP